MVRSKNCGMNELEDYATDGRLTEPSDGNRYEWRKMIEEVKRLGRPLTEEEVKKFQILPVDSNMKSERYGLEAYKLASENTKYDEAGRAVLAEDDESVDESEWDVIFEQMKNRHL